MEGDQPRNNEEMRRLRKSYENKYIKGILYFNLYKLMKKACISIIAAIGEETRALGKNNQLLWRISPDLKRFKALTLGHPVIMGRKTFESIGRPLLGRLNIVITRNEEFKAPGVILVHSLGEALEKAQKSEKIFIIGGGELYKEALPLADKLYLTLVKSGADGDVFFPEYRNIFTKEIFREEHTEEPVPYTWLEMEK